MTGKAIVSMGRRGCAFFATMLVVLVLGDRLEMLRSPSASRCSARSGHPDVKVMTNQRSFLAIVYADAQQGAWQEQSDVSEGETDESGSQSVVRRRRRRGSLSGRGRRDEPLYKKYAKELTTALTVLLGVLALWGGYKYLGGSSEEDKAAGQDGAGAGGGNGAGQPVVIVQ